MSPGRIALAAALLAAAGAARAQSVEDCDWRVDMRFIAEPWEANTRTFGNGDVRLVLIDTYEPAAIPFQLVVISPPWGDEGWPQCKAVGAFAGVDFAGLDAAYDPGVGLLFSLPVTVYEADTGGFADRMLDVTLNQATGAIAAFVGPRGE